jgi:uncharacterized protein
MKRFFIDSSVFFSAAYSEKGASRELLLMGARGEILLVVSPLVLEETRRNISQVSSELADLFDLIVVAISFEIVQPTKEEVIPAAEIVALKDAPILAAARKAGTNLLVTLDKKHLLGKPQLVAFAGMPIVAPGEAMAHHL